jgi:hypothetical protein
VVQGARHDVQRCGRLVLGERAPLSLERSLDALGDVRGQALRLGPDLPSYQPVPDVQGDQIRQVSGAAVPVTPVGQPLGGDPARHHLARTATEASIAGI